MSEPSRHALPTQPSDPTRHRWESAFQLYYVELCEYVLRFVGSAGVAEDLVHDLFLRLWDLRDRPGGMDLTRSYLHVAARNRALKYLRHRRVASAWVERAAREEAPSAASPEDLYLRRELADAVARAIAELPARCREVFVLRRYQHLSYHEIAARAGVSLGTVKSQMWRATVKLKEKLAPYLFILYVSLGVLSFESPMVEQADLLRLIEGDCSPQEAAAIQAWVAADPRRGELLDQLRAVWRLTGRTARDWDIPETHGRPARAKPSLEIVPPTRRWWMAPRVTPVAAASIAVLVAGSLLWLFPRRAEGPHSYATARGQLSSLTLPDGSRVLLGVDTRLRVPRDYGTRSRRVDLEGEAYFVVEHDAKRPFIVRTEHGLTQDLGTEFAVRAYRQDPDVEVVVAEGRVALRGLQGADPVLVTLHPRERAVLDSSGEATITHDVPLASALAWTRGALMFDDAPLDRVIAQLERWYDLEIETNDTALADERVTISFMTKSADEAVRALAQVLDVRATRTGRLVHFNPVRARH